MSLRYAARNAFDEVVVRDRELDLVLLLFEIDHDARGLLGPVERFVHRVERICLFICRITRSEPEPDVW